MTPSISSPNKIYISGIDTNGDMIITIPSGVSYIRLCTERYNLQKTLDAEIISNFTNADIIKINKEISDNENFGKRDTSNLTQGCISKTSGSVDTYLVNEKYKCTDFLLCNSNDYIITNAACAGSCAGLAFYDSEFNYLNLYLETYNTNLSAYLIPNDSRIAYVRLSTEKYDITETILVYINHEERNKELLLFLSIYKNYKIDNFDSLLINTSNLLQGCFNKNSGMRDELGGYDRYKCTYPLPCYPNEFLITNAACSGSCAGLTFYDSNSNYLNLYIETVSNELKVYLVPNDSRIAYVRLSNEHTDITNGIVAYKTNNIITALAIEIDKANDVRLNKISNTLEELSNSIFNVKKPFFNNNLNEWIADEIIKNYTPSSNIIEHKYKSYVNQNKRFVVMGFDDGRESDRTFIMPLFEKYGFKAEFNQIRYNTSLDRDNAFLNNLIDGGHEIGDHTWMHYKFPFSEPLFNGLDPDIIEGDQIAYPSNDDMRNDRGDGKNAFGHSLNTSVIASLGYLAPDINTAWKDLSNAECQQIRNYYSLMKDTTTNLISLLDNLSNTYLGTTGNSVGSWDSQQNCYTGGIFTGCKTSANHEVWERILDVTNLFYKDKFGLNYNLKTWSLPGSKTSYCYYENDGKYYYDKTYSKFVNNLAKFPSSLLKNNDGTPKMRSWDDVLTEFGYHNTNDSEGPGSLDGQTVPCMSIQYIFNADKSRPNATIFGNIFHRSIHYVTIANEYTKGESLTGTKPYEVQMYDNDGSFKTAIETWRMRTANGIIAGEIIDSQDTWSERLIIEGLLKYCKKVGIEVIPLEEAYDICFNHPIIDGNLVYNPTLRNTAKEFLPEATTVPSNPDGYNGDCEVLNENGIPVLKTNGNTIYEHYGIPIGNISFSVNVKGSGAITIREIKNSTDYNNRNSGTILANISIDESSYTYKNAIFIIKNNQLTEFEQRTAGYGDKIIGISIEYSNNLFVHSIIIKKID